MSESINPINMDQRINKSEEKRLKTPETYRNHLNQYRNPDGTFTKGKVVGRPKGARNKVTASQKISEVEQRMGVTLDPLEGMAQIAADETNDIQVRLAAFREMAKYLYAQRKAVDMSIEETRGEASSLSDSDLESIIAADFGGGEEQV